MGHANCTRCSRVFTFDVMPRRGAICFACHATGVNLGFTQGKDDFHGPTIREKQRNQEAIMNGAGIAWEKLPEKATW